MVNLEEILESEKKPYTCPTMQIKFLDWSDIVTESQPHTKESFENDVDLGEQGDADHW